MKTNAHANIQSIFETRVCAMNKVNVGLAWLVY